MLVQVCRNLKSALLQLGHHALLRLCWKVDKDGKAGLLAILDSILQNGLLDRVLGVGEVDNLVAKGRRLHPPVTLVDEGA